MLSAHCKYKNNSHMKDAYLKNNKNSIPNNNKISLQIIQMIERNE